MNLRTYLQTGTAAVLAASLTAYPAMPGRSAETTPLGVVASFPVQAVAPARPLQTQSLSKSSTYLKVVRALNPLDIARLPDTILSETSDAKKGSSLDPGIQAACGDFSLDPKIEMQTEDLSIDPKMVDSMGASDGSGKVFIDPSTIHDWAKLRSELSGPPTSK